MLLRPVFSRSELSTRILGVTDSSLSSIGPGRGRIRRGTFLQSGDFFTSRPLISPFMKSHARFLMSCRHSWSVGIDESGNRRMQRK